ncbi:MAG TPA: DUF2007 domain-containing protein [Isosphaeraceae bacterium]|jgi:hypothetical protein|nr:DUF2007 domain-containing protein [Isosphaeraceae bacterium]
MAHDDPVEVYTAKELTKARFVHNLLADAGIDGRVVGEPLGAVVGRVPQLDAMPRVWVRAADAERARSLIEQYQHQHREKAGRAASELGYKVSFCYHCGQVVGEGESPCPECGKELDWETSQES